VGDSFLEITNYLRFKDVKIEKSSFEGFADNIGFYSIK